MKSLDTTTLEQEWESYCEHVLVKNGMSAESAAVLRMVFYSGAGSMLSLLSAVPVGQLRDELSRYLDRYVSPAGHA